MINTLYFTVPEEKNQSQRVFDALQNEQKEVGYYSLPDQDTIDIIEYCKVIPKEISYIVVIGIGGSSLGAKAVYEFIKPSRVLERELYFFESTDPTNIRALLEKIELEKTHFLVISKSGTTIETFAVYKYVYNLHSDIESYTFITDKGSPLEKYAQSIRARVFYLEEGVGGRFSVLSCVGLLPLALSGVDIKELLRGAKKIKESFFGNGYMKDILLQKALFYAKHHAEYSINCLFAYSESLKYLCEWYVQLWGESLGKQQKHSAFHVGLTPIGLIGPKDQHSFLQLLMEGTRDKSVTFIKIDNFNDTMSIPDMTLTHLESMDILNGLSFAKLINMQCDAVTEALLEQKNIPIDTITVPNNNECSIGMIIYYYELLTSLVGQLIDIDTYNQPGVEVGKSILKEKLTQGNTND